MKLRVIGPYGGDLPGCFMNAFLLNETHLFDAGTIGQVLGLKEQAKIRHVVLSHAHLDHIAALPFMAVNIFANDAPPVRIYGLQDSLDALMQHVMNNKIWPDFTKINKPNGTPVFETVPMEEGKECEVGDMKVTPVLVNHPVPTAAMVIQHEGKSLVYSADTGVTEGLWEAISDAPNLRGIIVETSFPNKMEKLAEVSGHLTPLGLKKELKKVRRALNLPILIFAMKPEYEKTLKSELKALKIPKLEMLKTGKVYSF